MTRVTVWDWERGVRFRRGVITGEVGPGRHRLRLGEQVRTIDLRPTSLLLTGQDVPAADGVLVRLGIVLRWSVTDATTYLKAAGDALAELHVVAQLALRRAVSTRAHDELDPQREAIATEVAEGVAARVAELGAAVHEVTVRDVVLPNELRRAAVAEIVARKEGPPWSGRGPRRRRCGRCSTRPGSPNSTRPCCTCAPCRPPASRARRWCWSGRTSWLVAGRDGIDELADLLGEAGGVGR